MRAFKKHLTLSTALLVFGAPAFADPASITDSGLTHINGITPDGSIGYGSVGDAAGLSSFSGSPFTFNPGGVDTVTFTGYLPDAGYAVGTVTTAGFTQSFVLGGGSSIAELASLGDGNQESFVRNAYQEGSAVLFVGSASDGTSLHAVVWTDVTPTQLDELPGGTMSEAFAFSPGSGLVVGYSNGTGHPSGVATAWIQFDNLFALALPASAGSSGVIYDGSQANAASTDGSTIVGSSNYAQLIYSATKWVYNGTDYIATDIGNPAVENSYALAVDADGGVIVGKTDTYAFRYTDAGGMKNLNTLLTNAGVNMTGITLTDATGISDDGTLIAANSADEGYVVFYDGGIAGATTVADQQAATAELSHSLTNSLAQGSATGVNLLGSTRPITSDSYAFTGAMIGSAEGMFGGQYSRGNATLIGGVAYGHEDYQDVHQSDTTSFALAARYLFNPVAKNLRPYVELGGWGTPDETLILRRYYANGAGTAIGTGNAGAYSYAGYGRAGLAYDLTPKDKLSTYAELGQQTLHYDGYTEALSSANPFPAQISGGDIREDVARIGASLTHTLTTGKYPLTGTVSGGFAHAFNESGTLRVNTSGIGATQASATAPTWGEFGASLGVGLTQQLSANVGILGTSGDSNMGTQLHGTAGLSYKF